MAAHTDRPRPDLGEGRYFTDPNIKPLLRRILMNGKLTAKDMGNFGQGDDEANPFNQARSQDNET